MDSRKMSEGSEVPAGRIAHGYCNEPSDDEFDPPIPGHELDDEKSEVGSPSAQLMDQSLSLDVEDEKYVDVYLVEMDKTDPGTRTVRRYALTPLQASLCGLIDTMATANPGESIEIPEEYALMRYKNVSKYGGGVTCAAFRALMKYLQKRNGKPSRAIHTDEKGEVFPIHVGYDIHDRFDELDVRFINKQAKRGKQHLYDLLHAANYLEIVPVVHLAAIKVAEIIQRVLFIERRDSDGLRAELSRN